MFDNVVKFLNQPYPDQDDFQSMIKGAISTVIIVFLILVLFAPFGLSETQSNIFYHPLIFGLISGVTSLLVELFFKYVVKLKRDAEDWKFWKWILSVLFLILIITIPNHYYAVYSFGGGQRSFLRMAYNTYVVGIFPIIIFGSINLIKNLKANQQIAAHAIYKKEDLNASANVSLPIKNSTKTFDIAPGRILYLEAMQNYVLIYYLNVQDQVIKETHRNTISAVEEALSTSGIKRTHRSYLVNPQMISSITGNAQGLKLSLKFAEAIVPVSRKYIHEFKGTGA